MPRSSGFSVENNFTKGVVTEFTGLNFPENAAVDALNVVFDRTGRVYRRLGFDLELNAENNLLSNVDSDDVKYNSFLWKNVANIGTQSFVVVQIGSMVNFFSPDNPTTLSSSLNATTINLDSYRAPGAPTTETANAQFAEGNGYLFITHPYADPLAVSYDPTTNVFTVTRLYIQIRDFKGVDDGITDLKTRPTTLTALHKYNLFNQGWYATLSVVQAGPSNVLDNWHSFRALSDYPSNSDQWWVYKTAQETFSVNEVDKIDLGNTPAPKGHYILSAFNQDRSDVSGIPGLTVETSSFYRPSTVAFFAGRVFYGGVDYSDFSNTIYYSQIVKDYRDYYKCYQKQDPTREDGGDLLATDGGVIKILDASKIYNMIALQNALYIFASNGVWSISGSQGLGFSSTDYVINKISDIGAVSASSFVNAAGLPFWWNEDGVYTLSPTQGGDYQVASVTEQTIKTLYQDISLDDKQNAQGAFSLSNKEILWFYQDDDNNYTFLNYRLANQSWCRWTVSNVRKMVSIFSLQGFATSLVSENVTDNLLADVTTAAGVVTINVATPISLESTFKVVLVKEDNTYTFGEFTNSGFLDWFSISGEFYDSYAITGYKIRGDALRKQQNNYLKTYYDLQIFPTGTCYVEGLWDYANDPDSKRYTNRQNVYNPINTNFNYSSSKRKIRGTGRSLQLKFSSFEDQPFSLIGWSMFDTVNAGV